MSDNVRLLVFDPGGTTGWSVWDMVWHRPLELLAHGMQKGGVRGFGQVFRQLVDEWHPTRVVSESFILDGRTAFPDLTPKEVEGAIAVLWDGAVVLQRNTEKRHAPDSMLKRLGFYFPGDGHDRDSVRHAIAHAFILGHPPTVEWVMDRLTYE